MKINLPMAPTDDARIELIPLIDVIFCILTFFLLAAATMTRQQAINVRLPQARTAASQTQKTLVVSLDPSGRLYIDRQAVSQTELVRELLDYLTINPQGMILLNADRTLSYQQVISALDVLRAVGGSRVALATNPPATTNRPASTATPGLEQPLPDDGSGLYTPPSLDLTPSAPASP